MTGRLSGTVVATTREGDPDDALARALRAEGADVRAWPTLTFRNPADVEALQEAIERMDRYAWLAFTSPRAVQAVTSRGDWREGCGRVAAVGPTSAAALRDAGWPVHVVGVGGGAEGLVQAMEREGSLAGSRVLFFAGSLARPTLDDGLAARGASVDRVEAYRTELRPPDPVVVRQDLREGVTALLFASPSAVLGVREALGGDLASHLAGAVAVAIGATTATALEEAGVEPRVADETSVDGLVSACIDIAQRNEKGRT